MQTRQRRYPSYVRDADREDVDPNHHLWRNGRRWWIAVTVHLPDGTARRVRRSLGTDDLATARSKRDGILKAIDGVEGVTLSLRYACRVA